MSTYLHMNPLNARKLAAYLLEAADHVEASDNGNGYQYTAPISGSVGVSGPIDILKVRVSYDIKDVPT